MKCSLESFGRSSPASFYKLRHMFGLKKKSLSKIDWTNNSKKRRGRGPSFMAHGPVDRPPEGKGGWTFLRRAPTRVFGSPRFSFLRPTHRRTNSPPPARSDECGGVRGVRGRQRKRERERERERKKEKGRNRETEKQRNRETEGTWGESLRIDSFSRVKRKFDNDPMITLDKLCNDGF